MILRVPMLYGKVESLQECAMAVLFKRVQDTDKVHCISSYERRFPTHVEDVALVIRDLVARKLQVFFREKLHVCFMLVIYDINSFGSLLYSLYYLQLHLEITHQ